MARHRAGKIGRKQAQENLDQTKEAFNWLPKHKDAGQERRNDQPELRLAVNCLMDQ